MLELAGRIKTRRLGIGLSQQEAARRASVAYSTWRRLENLAQASIEDLVKAAVALRCEEALDALFPEPAAANLDELLERQAAAHAKKAAPRKRVRPSSAGKP